AARRLGRRPASASDARLQERRVRDARARAGWKAALAALRRMEREQRDNSRWQWFEARMLELTGDRAGAQAMFEKAAAHSDCHGFLAADRLDRPYALCPWMPDWSEA